MNQFMTDPRFNAFFLLTGFTFIAFASGFSVCLFNMETIDACVAVSRHWFDVLKDMGDHVIEWTIALVRAMLRA
jgi:hypothetical protein